MKKFFNKKIAFKLFLLLVILILHFESFAQNILRADTLSISLTQAEKRFLDSNFLLLASHYNVDAQNALIEQAKLWDNPTLNLDKVIAAHGQFWPSGKNPDGTYNGQYYIQVQQLIKTAGKRGKLVCRQRKWTV